MSIDIHKNRSEIGHAIEHIKDDFDGVDEYTRGYLDNLEEVHNRKQHKEDNSFEETSEYQRGYLDAKAWLEDETETVKLPTIN